MEMMSLGAPFVFSPRYDSAVTAAVREIYVIVSTFWSDYSSKNGKVDSLSRAYLPRLAESYESL